MTPVDDQPTAAAPRGIFDPQLLDRCISCGFCLPACPTYALSADEGSSPRGRITLMRALETGRLDPDDARLREESSFCLGCRACEPVCPAGVQYGELLEEWRDHQWRGRRRPPVGQALMLAVSRPWMVRMLGSFRRHARGRPPGADGYLMLGCFERMLYPEVSRAARRLLPDLAAPPAQGCCGALHAHNGESRKGKEMARRLGEQLPGLIVTTAGGCVAHMAGVLGPERVRELSQHLVLTGAITSRDQFGADDFRATHPRFQEDTLAANLRLVEAVRGMAEEKGVTAAQLALAWVLAQGPDVVPIPGTKRRRYLEDNVAAADVELTSDDLARLADIAPPGVAAGGRYRNQAPGYGESPEKVA